MLSKHDKIAQDLGYQDDEDKQHSLFWSELAKRNAEREDEQNDLNSQQDIINSRKLEEANNEINDYINEDISDKLYLTLDLVERALESKRYNLDLVERALERVKDTIDLYERINRGQARWK